MQNETEVNSEEGPYAFLLDSCPIYFSNVFDTFFNALKVSKSESEALDKCVHELLGICIVGLDP